MIDNARLKNAFQLKGHITIYVPSTTDINKTIDTTEYVEKTASLLSRCFGGSTSTEALGYWQSATAGLVKEKSTMVFSYCSESDIEKNLDDVIDWCEQMRYELKQDAIALELNGIMHFI